VSKPSILILNRVYPPERGPTGRMMQDLARALIENGWKVTVISCTSMKEQTPPKSVNHQLIYSRVKAKGLLGYGWLWWRMLLRGLRQPKHDVVLTMTDPPILVSAGRILSRFKRAKHVHWCQDMYPDLFPALQYNLPKFLLKRLKKSVAKSYRKLDHMVVIGGCMGERMVTKNVPAERLSLIPNWADFEVISPSTGGVYTQSVRVIIEAAEHLAEHKEIEFVFVGDTHAHSRLAEERQKRGLENIRFIPFQPIEQLRSVMEAGDLHLVTMRESASGMLVPCKFYSGLTVGRPTIFAGPENCEISDVINHYKCGAVVSPTDGQALAEMIYNYRMDGDLWFNAQQGALVAAQAYHPTQSLNIWVELLEAIRQAE